MTNEEIEEAEIKKEREALTSALQTTINTALYDRIVEASRIMLERDTNPNLDILSAIESYVHINKNENKNEVTEIYLYEEASDHHNKKLKDTILHSIVSVIGSEYANENIKYIENIIRNGEDIKSTYALDYYLKLGRYHDTFTNGALSLVENNLFSLSRKQLSTVAWYLINLYPNNYRVQNILRFIEEKEGISFSNAKEETNHSETPETPKPWWKFW